jgi:hypothetical protein
VLQQFSHSVYSLVVALIWQRLWFFSLILEFPRYIIVLLFIILIQPSYFPTTYRWINILKLLRKRNCLFSGQIFSLKMKLWFWTNFTHASFLFINDVRVSIVLSIPWFRRFSLVFDISLFSLLLLLQFNN